jgi:hypothetical protein
MERRKGQKEAPSQICKVRFQNHVPMLAESKKFARGILRWSAERAKKRLLLKFVRLDSKITCPCSLDTVLLIKEGYARQRG